VSENALAEAATRVARELEPLEVNQRQRVIRTALMLLGDAHFADVPQPGPIQTQQPSSNSMGAPSDLLLRRLGLTSDQVEQFLHFEGENAIPIGLPGGAQSKREQTMNTYLLAVLAAALSSTEARFSDIEARNLCVQFGCFDAPNHVRIVKALGNKITGSKDSGWKLTSPGLAAAASLIKSGN